MHITLETDYAIRIVDALAKEAAKKQESFRGCIDAGTIAERTEVPLRFALKILRKLVSGGIVKSYKGVYGGYRLIAKLSEISVYDVMEIVEGEYHFSRCLSEGYRCNCGKDGAPCNCGENEASCNCNYRRVFGELSEIVRDYLKKQTFDKLVDL